MAKSGTIKGNKIGNYGVEIDWSASQSVADNSSTITAKVYITYYSIDIKARSGGKCTIDGTTYTYSTAAINHNAGSAYRRLVATKAHTVKHGSDGTRKCSISASFPFDLSSSNYGHIGTLSASDEVELDTIDRESAITKAADVTLGTSCSVKWTPASASFRYVLEFSMGGWSYTTGVIHPNQTSAYTYTGYKISLDAAKQIPNASSGTMKVTLYTYSDKDGTVPVGSADSATFTVTVPDSSDTRPTVSMTLAPVHSLPDAFAGLYIQGKTKVKATLSATAKYGASVKAYTMKVESATYDEDDGLTSGYLAGSGNITVYGYAKDSRGLTGSVSKAITVIGYGKPQILAATGETDVVAARCDKDGNITDSGTYLKIKAKRSYSKLVSGGAQRNFCKIRYRYKKEGGAWSSWVTILAADSLASDEIKTGALLNGALDAKSTYYVQVQAIDDIGEAASTTIAIQTDKVYWHRNGKRRSFTFGGYVEDDNTFAIAEDITFKAKGPLQALGGGNIDCLTLGTKLTATANEPISLNNIKTPGNYYSPNAANSQYIAGSPYTAGGFGMTVREMQTTGFIRQELFYGRTTWIRHFDGESWSDWWRYQTTTVPETACADYVIETGVTDGWTWKKWKDGTYQAFGTFEVKPSESTQNESLYRTNNMTIALPFNISSAYVSGTAVGYYWITNGGISGDSAITLRIMSDKAFDTTKAIEVRLTVMGKTEE